MTTGSRSWENSYSAPYVATGYIDTIPSNPPQNGAGDNKVGVYYNYCAASAGSYCYGNGTNSGTSVGNATEDICPAGWRLPTGGTGGEFQALYSNDDYNEYTKFKTALSLPLSGYYENSSVHSQGAHGFWWSSTRFDGERSQILDLDTTFANRGGFSLRSYGFSIRCIMKPTMQNATSASLAAVMPNTNDSITLTDARDGQDYTIAKLADGKYWMTKNLNIAGGTALGAADTSYEPSYNHPTTGGWTTSVDKLVMPASSTSGFSSNNYAYVYNTNNETDDCASPGCYSYYSWDAATLGSGRSIAAENTDALYSICPKGWRLPTSGSGADNGWKRGDFYRLATAYGADLENDSGQDIAAFYNNAGRRTVANFLLAGRYEDGTLNFDNDGGFYWSSTSYENTLGARSLQLNKVYVNSATSNYRRFGLPARCLYDDRDITNVSYMQEVTSTILRNTTVGTTASLKDKRDEQSYMVSKLADGNLWMLDNLALDPTALTQAQLYGSDTYPLTNADNTTLGYLKNGGGSSPYTNYPISSSWGSTNHYDRPLINTTNKDVEVTSYGAAAVNGKAKVGVYYNYCAASAGTYCYTESSSSGNATADICPASWHLPEGNTNVSGSFYYLYNDSTYGYNRNATNFRNTLSTPLSGWFSNNDGIAHSQNSHGNFWSSTRYSNANMNNLYVSSSGVDPQGNYYRSIGNSIRCVRTN